MYIIIIIITIILIYVIVGPPAVKHGSEVTFGRGDLRVCPLGGLIGAQDDF